MIKRPTWILLALFAVVLAGAFIFQRTRDETDIEATPTAELQALLDVSSDAIASLKIEDAQGRAVALGRDEAGLWTVTEPEAGETDLAQAESAVSQLVALRPMTRLEAASNLSAFGLLKPSHTITLVMNGGEKYVILVGDVTPTNNGYYVRLNENPPEVVNKYSLDAVIRMIEEPPYQPTATPELEVEGE